MMVVGEAAEQVLLWMAEEVSDMVLGQRFEASKRALRGEFPE